LRPDFCEPEFPGRVLVTTLLDLLVKIHNHIVVDKLSTAFAALSDPTRRHIVDRLTRGPATVAELTEPFSVSQQAISKHLAYLERARLIQREKIGRENFCTLNPLVLRDVASWAERYRRFWEESYERLDMLLEEMKPKEKSARGRRHRKKERSE
jgi:DNA-binding transcriptional ArsR family regulator